MACKNVTAEDLKCMTDAGAKNGTDIEKHCKGVDMDALAKGEVGALCIT